MGTGWSKDPKNAAKYRANQKYLAANSELMSIRVAKGTRDKYKTFAANLGITLTKLIIDSMDYCLSKKIFENNA